MREPIIELSGIVKTYRTGRQEVRALQGIDLAIPRGEFVSVTGPSGSGKTTLLNVVAGLDAPDAGRVIVDGHDLAALPDSQLAALRLQRMGFVFQSFNLLPALTVLRNVSWPLQFAGRSRREAMRRGREVLERVGLTDQHDRYPAELSGGEQQRVAIARAIAIGPAILLADEPTGNLDSRTGQEILDLLRGQSRSGVTVIMVTHNLAAAAYGDRTIELQDGRVLCDVRTPEGRPSLTLVAGEPG